MIFISRSFLCCWHPDPAFLGIWLSSKRRVAHLAQCLGFITSITSTFELGVRMQMPGEECPETSAQAQPLPRTPRTCHQPPGSSASRKVAPASTGGSARKSPGNHPSLEGVADEVHLLPFKFVAAIILQPNLSRYMLWKWILRATKKENNLLAFGMIQLFGKYVTTTLLKLGWF